MKLFSKMKGLHFKKPETSKLIVWFCLLNGTAWIWCSYILAWNGKPEIAEQLSITAVVQIIGVVVGYFGKALVEQLSKYNSWPDKSVPIPISRDEEEYTA